MGYRCKACGKPQRGTAKRFCDVECEAAYAQPDRFVEGNRAPKSTVMDQPRTAVVGRRVGHTAASEIRVTW